MKINVRVKPRSRVSGVVPQPDGSYVVSVNVPPVDGKANEKLIELLAEHFRRPKRDVVILKGASGRQKTVEIADQ